MTDWKRLFESVRWGDLHNHNEIGYGKGSLERSYRIAHGALLDVYAFTPHGYWHDAPAGDANLTNYHDVGFREKVQPRWTEVAGAAEAENSPGEFVALRAFEWHSSTYGDYHVLLPDARGEIQAARAIDELQRFVREHDGVMIPHHVAYRQGWRGTNWNTYSSEVSPVVDVFSEHGNGFEGPSHLDYLLHSMGGVERSQTALTQLCRGTVFGVVASTDNHFGHPASYGEGLAAILTSEVNRRSVLDALRARRTYAVTGDRILLSFTAGGAPMGSILPATSPRRFDVCALGLSPFESVGIVKNGRKVAELSAAGVADADEDAYIVRIDFGWGSMTSQDVTGWRVEASVAGGEITRVVPCFAGGAGSTEKVNAVTERSAHAVAVRAFTSRANPRPTSGVVLQVSGNGDTRIQVTLEAEHDGRGYSCGVSARVGELLESDAWTAISDVFSAPRVRLGNAYRLADVSVAGSWTDPHPAPGDFYLLRALQRNGHMAWSSPIWFRG